MSAWACVLRKLYFIECTSGLEVHRNRDLNFSGNCKPQSIKRSHPNKTENTHNKKSFLASYQLLIFYFNFLSFSFSVLDKRTVRHKKGVWRNVGIQKNPDHILLNMTRWANTFNYILPALFALEGRKTSNNCLSKGRDGEREEPNEPKPTLKENSILYPYLQFIFPLFCLCSRPRCFCSQTPNITLGSDGSGTS